MNKTLLILLLLAFFKDIKASSDGNIYIDPYDADTDVKKESNSNKEVSSRYHTGALTFTDKAIPPANLNSETKLNDLGSGICDGNNNQNLTEQSDNNCTDDEEEELENFRSILLFLQKFLLFMAAITFSFIVIYTAYYINILRQIYAKDIKDIKINNNKKNKSL